MNAVSVCDVLISQRILLPLSALAAILTYIPDCPQLVPSVKLGFMFIWPSREWALRWPMVGITKKAIIFCHLNSHTAFFFSLFFVHRLLQPPDFCSVSSWRWWGRMHAHPLPTALLHHYCNSSDSSHHRIRISISEDLLSSRSYNQLCNDCPRRGWNHLLPQYAADVIALYSG